MKTGLLRSLLAVSLMCFGALAMAQPPDAYVPMQPTHWGNWYDATQAGEGMELSVIDNEDAAPTLFANIYVLTEGGPYWASAVGDAADVWNTDLAEYELVLYQRAMAGGEPFSVGSLWLKPNIFGQMHWRVLIGEPLIFREAWLTQLTMPIPGVIGRCGPSFSFPPPPAAQLRFCHG